MYNTQQFYIINNIFFRLISFCVILHLHGICKFTGGRRGRDRMVVGFITNYAITNVVSSNPIQARCTRYYIM
jgi:hypothetical protein